MAHILVIEDEADIRQVLEYNLRQAGHEVSVAERGEAGLARARQRRPDLVLLDLMLPDISGLASHTSSSKVPRDCTRPRRW